MLTGKSQISIPGKTLSSPAEIANTLECSEFDVSYSPMDMNTLAVNITQEPDVAACQERCELTRGCAHFSYWEARGDCHLQNIYAVATHTRIGFIGGPPSCVKRSGEDFDTVFSTLQQQTCFDPDTQYTPVEGQGHIPHFANTVLDCQQSCQQYAWCAYFSFNGLTYTCSLQTADATPVRHQMTMTAGPKRCQGQLWLQFHAGLNWLTVGDETRLRQKFEVAVVYSVAKSSSLIHRKNVAVITDHASYGLIARVVVASPQDISIDKIADAINSDLPGLHARIVKEVSSIKGITGHAVNKVNTHSLRTEQIIEYTANKSTVVDIEQLTPAFVSRPFQGIGNPTAASAAASNPYFNLAVKVQTSGKALRVPQDVQPAVTWVACIAGACAAATFVLLLYTRSNRHVVCRRRMVRRTGNVKAQRTSSRDMVGAASNYTSLEVLHGEMPQPDRQLLLGDLDGRF